ncbi:MAG: PSD1 and planctomycete cytochrome C domain-containing protein [Verrucomicrobiales bacterium]
MRTAWFIVSALVCGLPPAAAVESLDFNRDVRPILSDKCFRCHGPDENERKAKLRLDSFEGATRELEGRAAIVAGQPGKSELVRRIHASDPDDIMPPPETKKSLTIEEKAKLERWIAEGASYKQHWAFLTPKRPATPVISGAKNPLDGFISARLEKDGFSPAPEASKESLIRRVTFDLIGLPPTVEEIDVFLADASSNAYENIVDRLLESPRFGERMCLHWLDLARYADTHGYHLDSGRDMWRWREWVIDAFNNNMPFDRFVTEQLAGDLLPNASRDQILATGFCRNNMINFEGGAIAEEYLNAYIVDRVTTFSTVFLGLTMQCAQCHDHKFDPVTMRDFYGLYAFFNAVPERGLDGNKGNAEPAIPVPSPEQERTMAGLKRELDAAEAAATADPESLCGSPERFDAASRAVAEFEKQIPTAMVMRQMDKPRETFMLMRGQYDQRGEKVSASVPAVLGAPPSNAPANRLALSGWLTSPDHPLLARVTVNRFWAMFFGAGLVKTVSDFGSQGEWPTHPELLDWLAVDFQESGWDMKRLLRIIVTSGAYRQAAAATPALLERDPANRLLARGPRQRLQAEFIRDMALSVSGLLDERLGGPSVFPYQPPGLWEELNSRGDSANWSGQKFVQSHGRDLYRRGMYTYWKRTCPPPNLANFDAPDRETCSAQRSVTNTPLQALTLLNDPTFVEAARLLADRMLGAAESSAPEKIAVGFRLCTSRLPSNTESSLLHDFLEKQRARFAVRPEDAKAVLAIGERPANKSLNEIELAAWTSVAAALLNLDEAITR